MKLDISTPDGRKTALEHWARVFASRATQCGDRDDIPGAEFWTARAADYNAKAQETHA